MSRFIVLVTSLACLQGCITAPIPSTDYRSECDIATQRLQLKIIDVAKGTNSDSVEGYLISPVLVPLTAIPSAVIVLINNIVNFAEEKIRC